MGRYDKLYLLITSHTFTFLVILSNNEDNGSSKHCQVAE